MIKKVVILIILFFSSQSLLGYAFVHGSTSEYPDGVLVSIAKNPAVMDRNLATTHSIKRGNKGRGAEWNWKSIEKQLKKEKGSQLKFMIHSEGHKLPIETYEGWIRTDGVFGFILKKDSKKGIYTVEESLAAKREYIPAK